MAAVGIWVDSNRLQVASNSGDLRVKENKDKQTRKEEKSKNIPQSV